MKSFILLVFLLLVSSCHSDKKIKNNCGAQDFYKTSWEEVLKDNPIFASNMGWGDDHSRFSPKTIAHFEAMNEKSKKNLEKVKSFLKDPNCKEEKVNLELLEYSFKSEIEGFQYESYLVQFQSMGGPHTWLPQLYKNIPLKTERNYQDYVKRLKQIPEQFMQARDLSLLGVKKGITPPKVTFKGYESTFLDLAKGDVEKNPFYQPFLKMPDDISLSAQKRLQEEAQKVIKENIQPCLLYTSPSPRDKRQSRMPSSA